MTLDIEGVLAESRCRDSHRPRWFGGYATNVPCVTCSEWAERVAAVLREQIAAWLGSDAVERGIVQRANAEDDRHFAAGSSHGLGAGEAVSLTLAALAAQVAPSRVPGEGS